MNDHTLVLTREMIVNHRQNRQGRRPGYTMRINGLLPKPNRLRSLQHRTRKQKELTCFTENRELALFPSRFVDISFGGHNEIGRVDGDCTKAKFKIRVLNTLMTKWYLTALPGNERSVDSLLAMDDLGGGSLLIAWQLKDKRVLVVGGGEVASQRIHSILPANANITVLSPQSGLHPRTSNFIKTRKDRITYHDRPFRGLQELEGMDMVLTALDDNDLSRQIVEMSRERRIPVNAADIPDLCDFYFGAQIRDGPLQIMISTNGNGPRMASLIKTRLQNGLTGHEGQAIFKVGQLRNKLKERAPGVGGEVGRHRMKWMTDLCNKWDMEDFTALDEATMERLLNEGWDKGRRIPPPEDIGIHRPKGRIVSTHATPMLQTAIAFAAGALTATLLLLYRGRK